MESPEKPWSVPVAVADIPDAGSHHEIVADAAARDAVANLAGLRTVLRLGASFDLTRRGDAVAVHGEVRAQVGQTCVVTLDPIDSDVCETVDLVFAPVAAETERAKKRKGEPPEPLENGVIDLGVIATEFLILGLDPYPRKQGAEFGQPQSREAAESPFAALGSGLN